MQTGPADLHPAHAEVPPAYDESIFIDDSKQNAQAAYNLGITGILYKNHKSFERALRLCKVELPDSRNIRDLIRAKKKEQMEAETKAAEANES